MLTFANITKQSYLRCDAYPIIKSLNANDVEKLFRTRNIYNDVSDVFCQWSVVLVALWVDTAQLPGSSHYSTHARFKTL